MSWFITISISIFCSGYFSTIHLKALHPGKNKCKIQGKSIANTMKTQGFVIKKEKKMFCSGFDSYKFNT